ncbi:MAG TPA: LysM domain-containing protein [Candidatus Angelobacter sp.]|nr:LysM domain-containing protein [Candidatus Angelobacter sp.]
MPSPGEVNHAIGQAYQAVFIAVLEKAIRGFENKFSVHTEPDKTSREGRSGKQFSFDFAGYYSDPLGSREVFGESKGYTKGSGLLADFRAFLAKAYVTSIDYPQNRRDLFWFVTNVPFACDQGSGVRSFDFVKKALTDRTNAEVQEIIGSGHIDDGDIRSLVERLGVFILTDSFLMNTDLSYKVAPGDNLWKILKKLYAGNAPSRFRTEAEQIARDNDLPSPDKIISGKRIRIRWRGLKSRAPYNY